MRIIVLSEQKLCERAHTTFQFLLLLTIATCEVVAAARDYRQLRLTGIYTARILKGEKPGRAGPAGHVGQADDVIE